MVKRKEKAKRTYKKLLRVSKDPDWASWRSPEFMEAISSIKSSKDYLDVVRVASEDLSNLAEDFSIGIDVELKYLQYQKCRLVLTAYAPRFLKTSRQQKEEEYHRNLFREFYDESLRIGLTERNRERRE